MPKPKQNIVPLPILNGWQVNALPADLELTPETDILPSGWVLFSANLQSSGSDCTAQLRVELENGVQRHFPLTVTLTGTVIELIQLPEDARRLILEPMQSLGFFQLNDITIKPVGRLERVSKMLLRVTPLYKSFAYNRLQLAGLHFYTPLLNLEKAYQIAGLFRVYSAAPRYEDWLEKFDLLLPVDRKKITQKIRKWSAPPCFEITILALSSSDLLEQTLESLEKQLFCNFRVKVLLPKDHQYKLPSRYLHTWLTLSELAIETDSFIAKTDTNCNGSTWLLFLRPGELLAEHALFWLANEALAYPSASFIYADYDFINAQNCRLDPVFNPDWSPELLRSTNYIANAATIRCDVFNASGGLSLTHSAQVDFHDLFLRCTENLPATAIRHIPALLWHLQDQRHIFRTRQQPPAPNSPLAMQQIQPHPVLMQTEPCIANPVIRHLERLNIPATVYRQGTNAFRVRYQLPKQSPKVSIIIPTRDNFHHISACVQSLLNNTSYNHYELIIVDNQSKQKSALGLLKDLAQHDRVRVIAFDHTFNFSGMNNLAASTAHGEVLCLLNNDTEIISTDWLEEMLGHLLQQQVGVVGAKLYFSDGRVQHAGDTVGPGGCANHLHRLIGRDDPGYCGRAQLAQDLSAVTAACLLTWKDLYLKLGGLDEKNLAVSFNDVDFCLRVRDAGYRVVWTPHAELYHHESVTRGKEETPEKIARSKAEADYIRRRWAHVMRHDPFYNPNLSYIRPDFSLSHTPMVKRPW